VPEAALDSPTAGVSRSGGHIENWPRSLYTTLYLRSSSSSNIVVRSVVGSLMAMQNVCDLGQQLGAGLLVEGTCLPGVYLADAGWTIHTGVRPPSEL